MNEDERKSDYEKSANEDWRWIVAAHDLAKAAAYLDKLHQNAVEKMYGESGTVPEGFGMDRQACYFKGKCLELYLKALYIRNGNPITDGHGVLDKLGNRSIHFGIAKNEQLTSVVRP